MTFKGDVKLLQTITKEFIERFNALNNIIADKVSITSLLKSLQ